MKRGFAALLVLFLILSLCSCSGQRADISREEIIAAYEAAGYEVWSGMYDTEMDSGIIAYVQANRSSGDYIHFAFFETEAKAKAYEQDMDHPWMKGFFSLIFGDPSWERMETYGCIVVTYDDPDFFAPFEGLLKS